MKRTLIIEVNPPYLKIHQVEKTQIGRTQIVDIPLLTLDYKSEDLTHLSKTLAKYTTHNTYNKVYWIIHQKHTIRKEMHFSGLSHKDLKRVLIHEASRHLHLQDDRFIRYQIIKENKEKPSIDILLTALASDVMKFYQALSKKLGVKKFEVIERCDVIANALSTSRTQNTQLLIDLDNSRICTIRGKSCLSQDKILTDNMALEILKRQHFYSYNEEDEEALAVRVLSDQEIELSQVQKLQTTINDEVYPLVYTPKLIQRSLESYTAYEIHKNKSHWIDTLFEHKHLLSFLVLLNIIVCMMNVLLKQKIDVQEATYQNLYSQQIAQQSQYQDRPTEKPWINLSTLDAILNHSRNSIQLLRLSWNANSISWNIEGDGAACLEYIMKMKSLFPTLNVQDQYTSAEKCIYNLKINL